MVKEGWGHIERGSSVNQQKSTTRATEQQQHAHQDIQRCRDTEFNV